MDFYNPVEIKFGSGKRLQLFDSCKKNNVLVICTLTAFDRLKEDISLAKIFTNENFSFEHGFSSNPSLVDIKNISHKFHQSNINQIIGIGGGSSMDVAKILCASIPALNKGYDITDLLEDPSIIEGLNVLQCIHVPTTAGTGSEVTSFATIWDYEAKKKNSLSHSSLYAKSAIIDPDLLITTPFSISLSTGLDAMNQAFESIWNKNASLKSLEYAEKAASLSLEWLPKIHNINEDKSVREGLFNASLMAGMAISNTRTSICHSISYPLTIELGIPHGLACAFSMKAVSEFNLVHITESLKKIESTFGRDPLEAVDEIFDVLEVEDEINLYIDDQIQVHNLIPEMKSEGRFENNIRDCSSEDLESIIIKSLQNLRNARGNT